MKNKANWPITPIGNVCRLVKGVTYKSEDYSTPELGSIFLTLKCIAKGGGFNTSGIKYFKSDKVHDQWLTSGDLIIANTDLTRAGDVIGAPLFVPKLNDADKYVYSMDISKIEIDEKKIYSKYLYHYLLTQSSRNYMRGISSGSTVLHLKVNHVGKLQIPLPSMANQEKIADILSSLDESIQKTDQIIQQCEQLKMGLVIDIFDKQEDAQMLKMKDISDVTSSKRVMVSDYVEEGVPFYRSTEIIKKSKNIPVIKPLYISQEKFDFFKNRFGAPIAGDLLITAVGTIGDVYLVQSETFYFKDGNTVWVRGIKDSVLPEYLKVILSSNFYRELLNNISGGSSQKALTIQKLENVEVPIPSISSQRKIIDLLSSVEENVLVNQKIKANMLILKQGLMQDIFSQKIEIN